jgi:hypothetical protein
MISCLLHRLAEHDVVLSLERGALRYSAPPSAYTAELRQAVAAARAEIVVALATQPAVPWLLRRHDAEELLTRLHANLIRARYECHGGAFPSVKVNVIGIWLEVCEGYVRDHAIEAARGWDWMQLLRGAVEHCRETACRGTETDQPPKGRTQ